MTRVFGPRFRAIVRAQALAADLNYWRWRLRGSSSSFAVSRSIGSGRSLKALVEGVIIGATAMVAAFAIHIELVADGVAQHYRHLDQLSQAVEIVDGRAKWIGIVPFQRDVSVATEPGWSPHPTLAVDTVPDAFIDVLVALEDQHVGSWRNWSCIDVAALTKIPMSILPGFNRRGGSSLCMQLIRSMLNRFPNRDDSIVATTKRKLREIHDGIALWRAYAGIRDPEWRRLLARHLPAIVGTRYGIGGTVHGIGLPARLLWGKAPEELTIAEAALLAAAVRRQLILTLAGDAEAERLRNERFEVVRDRAMRGLRLAYGPDDTRVLRAITQLNQMAPPSVFIDPELRGLLPEESDEAFQVAASPEARVGWFLSGELGPIRREVLALNKAADNPVVGVRLGIDAVDNLRFKRRVNEALVRKVVPHLKASPPGSEPDAAELLIALTNSKGVVVRHYSSTAWPLLFSARPVGSLGKAWVALEAGLEDSPNAQYCNRALPDGSVRNADGDAGVTDCALPGAMKSVTQTFAKSANLPLLDRLRIVPKARLQQLVSSYGLTPIEGVPVDRQLVVGMAEARPADVLALFQALGAGVYGKAPMGYAPHMIASIVRAKRNGRLDTSDVTSTTIANLHVRFTAPTLVPYLRTALGAPLLPQGTLAAVGRLPNLPSQALAKSGTTSLTLGGVRDRWIASTFPGPNGAAAFVLRLGTSDAETPLGSVPGAALAALIEPLFAPPTKQPDSWRSLRAATYIPQMTER